MASSWSRHEDGILKRVITVISPDISFVLICPKCDFSCEVTDDAIHEGRYDMVLKFLAEHSHVVRNEVRRVRTINHDKVRQAVDLLKASIE